MCAVRDPDPPISFSQEETCFIMEAQVVFLTDAAAAVAQARLHGKLLMVFLHGGLPPHHLLSNRKTVVSFGSVWFVLCFLSLFLS